MSAKVNNKVVLSREPLESQLERGPTASSSSTRPLHPVIKRQSSSTTNKHSRRKYVDAIHAYSKLSASNSLYAGLHFDNLAGYLLQPYEAPPPPPIDFRTPPTLSRNDNSDKEDPAFKFVTFYDLDPQAKKAIQHFHSIDEFEREASSPSVSKMHGQLLFMRGHPSAEWLTAIGAKYNVEPDFWQRHLDFRPQHPNFFSLPSLPSSSHCMLKLRIPTIGLARQEPGGTGSTTPKEALDSLRRQNSQHLSSYHEKLRSDQGLNLGDSIVRDCSVHDTGHFTIEQDISIHVKSTKTSWIAFIWLDNGRDIGEGATSWLSTPFNKHSSWKSKIKYLPVVQHKPGIALERRSPRFVAALPDGNGSTTSKIVQSASLLHLDYGRDLDRDVLAMDSFYALHEVFNFAAFADAQFLNMLASQLNREIDQSVLIELKNPTLSNLLYNQQILERYILRINNIIMCLESGNSGEWPRGVKMDQEMRKKAADATQSVLRDYKYLLRQGQDLCQRSNRGMQIIMNNAMIKESRDAMSQAEGIAKLTRLAFVFMPLSFTSTFFGMNVFQLGSGFLSLWVWVVVSFPIFGISVLSMKYDLIAVSRRFFVRGAEIVRRLFTKKNLVSFGREKGQSQENWDV